MLLTLDLSTRTGWTIGAVADPKFRYGTFVLPSTGSDIGRFAKAFDDWLVAQVSGEGADKVTEAVFESPILPRQTQLATVRKLSGLAWHTEFICTEFQIPCYEAHQQQVRKYVAGKGNAKKPDIVAAVRRYGYDVGEDDNQADAISVRLFTIATRYPELINNFPISLGPLGGSHATSTQSAHIRAR